MNETNEKLQKLKDYLIELGSVAIAYSAGVDSTFLLAVASEVLGDKAVAITVNSATFPEQENNDAISFCEKRGIKHYSFEVNQLEIPNFKYNPVDKCYICKKELFSRLISFAKDLGIANVVEGSNMDDMGDYRPGARAIKELSVLSPLQVAGLTKAEIRALSKEMDLPTWNKPSMACLATRFVYGEEITKEKLKMVELAERYLYDLGFSQVRVRVHKDIARIELEQGELSKAVEMSNNITDYLKQLGFDYVTLDLNGYKQGSMNINI